MYSNLGSLQWKLVLVFTAAMMPLVTMCLVLKCDFGIEMDSRRLLLAGAASSIALVSITAFFVGHKIAQKLRRLALVAAAFAAGDFRKRARISTRDELRQLADALNALGLSLTIYERLCTDKAEMLTAMVEAVRVAASNRTLSDVGETVAGLMYSHLGATCAAVFRKDPAGGALKLIGGCGKPPKSTFDKVALRSAASGDYLVVADHSSTTSGGRAEAFIVGLPLSCATGTLGAVVARYSGGVRREDLALGSERADVLLAFGTSVAEAVKNAEAYGRAERYSEVLEDWVEHLSSVMRVTDEISPSLDLVGTLKALVRATGSVLRADWCAIFLPERDGSLAMRSCWPETHPTESFRLPPDESDFGQAYIERHFVARYDLMNSPNPISREFAQKFGVRGLLSVPLLVEEKPIGALTVCSKEPREFTASEIRLLTAIGLHAALVVRNASLYTKQSSIAEALQRGLVPEVPETCLGLRFASCYVPSSDEARIGGDFFDVVALPNEKVAVVIADVSGKGLGAAMRLAMCKYMMRSLIFVDPENPANVLCKLNDAINYFAGASFFVTIFYALIDPNRHRLVYSSAGHPPAMLLSGDGKLLESLCSTGTPIGSGYECQYENLITSFRPGDTLFLYTDGAIDSDIDGEPLDIEGLHSMVLGVRKSTAPALVRRVMEQLCDSSRSHLRDDLALLAVSYNQQQTDVQEYTGGVYEHENSVAV